MKGRLILVATVLRWDFKMAIKKVTLITGASAGIGNLLARKALQDGYHVIVNARRLDQLEDLRKIAPDRVTVVVGDLTDKSVRQNLINAATNLGRLDYLINNAGFGWYGLLEAETDVEAMVALNVTALIEMTRLCIPILKKSDQGRILNIASVIGRIEIPFMVTYIATKFAVVGFSRALNIELANTNITVTAYCPAGVKTEFSRVAAGGENVRDTDKYAESAEKVVSSIWKQKDTTMDLIYPTFRAWITVTLTFIFKPFIVSVMRGIVRKKGISVLK